MIRNLKALIAALVLVLAPLPAFAQQVANHAIPIGKGPGVIGFGAVAAAANTKFLVGGGTSADPVMATMSGDCSLIAGAVTCLKTNGSSFVASATTDATNAANISSGTLPNARLDAEVQCIAGLASAADKVAYFTGSGTCALADFPSAMRTLLTTSSSANLRAFLSDETGTGLDYFQGGDLGTPSAGVGTNFTGIPISGLSPSTSTPLGVGSVELGAAADTTLARGSAGVLTVEGVTVPTISSTSTLTNKSYTAPVITGTADVQQALLLSGDISPTQITSSQNDYAPASFSTATTLRLNTDASRNITGLAGGAGGRVVIIHNVGSFPIVLTNQDAASSAANRFLFGGDMTLAADTSVTIKYDTTSSRWRAITSPGAGGGGGGITSVTVAAGVGIATSGTCTITTSGTCTVSEADQYRQNDLLMCANQAKALAGYQRILATFCDGYKASDGVNSGSSSNYTVTTASGYVGPTIGSGTSVQINANSGTLAFGGIYTLVDRTTAVLNSQTVGKIGVYSTAAATFKVKIALRNSSGNYTIVVDQSFSHPGGGWSDATLASPYAVPASGTYYLAAANTSNPASNDKTGVVARAFLAGDQTGTSGSYTEDSGTASLIPLRYSYGPANATVVTTTQTADATVSSGRVLMEIDPIDSITLNTDLTAEVTCDSAAHWASATLSSAGKGQAGRTVVESADTSCGANTGTGFAARIKNLNNKSVNIYKTTMTVH